MIATAVTATFFVILYWKSRIVFFINDDENILYTLAGYYTNGVPGDHSFVNYLLAFFIGGLYSLIPSIPWYGIFHVVVLFSSIVMIGKSLLKEASNSRLPWIIGVCVFSGLTVLCFIHPVTLMQFTVTSAMAGTAAVALLLTAESGENNWKHADYILSAIFMVVCYCHRKNTGNVILCFYALVMVYRLLKRFGQRKNLGLNVRGVLLSRPVITFLAAVLCIGVAVFISEGVVRTTDEWDAFYEYDEARFKVTDYAHDSYWQNEELYDSMGWTGSLYRLCCTGYLFFMDERVNADSFNAISATGYQTTNSTLEECLANFMSLFNGESLAVVCVCIVLLLFVPAVMISLKKWKENWLELLLGLCALGGAAIMTFYLCWKGRFILRAFQTIIYPTIIVLIVVLLRILGSLRIKKLNRVSKIAVAVAMIVIGAGTLRVGYDLMCETRLQACARIEKSNRTHLVEEYAMENPDNMYIYDTSLTFRYSPFITYTECYPSNLSYWGGMGWNSPTLLDQAEQNGIEKMYSDVFFGDNVYYVSYSGYTTGGGETIKDLFQDYMTETYGDVTIELVDEITSEIAVYKVSLAPDSES